MPEVEQVADRCLERPVVSRGSSHKRVAVTWFVVEQAQAVFGLEHQVLDPAPKAVGPVQALQPMPGVGWLS